MRLPILCHAIALDYNAPPVRQRIGSASQVQLAILLCTVRKLRSVWPCQAPADSYRRPAEGQVAGVPNGTAAGAQSCQRTGAGEGSLSQGAAFLPAGLLAAVGNVVTIEVALLMTLLARKSVTQPERSSLCKLCIKLLVLYLLNLGLGALAGSQQEVAVNGRPQGAAVHVWT